MKLINVTKRYGEHTVFQDFNLEIKEGEILCILGPSGSGKTTLLNILSGLCEFIGETQNLPKKSAYIFQEPRLLPNLTVEENLRYVGGMVEDIDKILQQIGLQDKKIAVQNSFRAAKNSGCRLQGRFCTTRRYC